VATRVLRWLSLPKRTIWAFFEHECTSQAAALAYYTVFSLAPLLLVTVAIAGAAFGREMVLGSILDELRRLLGPKAAEQVSGAVQASQQAKGNGMFGAALGFAALAFSATSAFAQLQSALNRIWEVKPDPQQSEIRSFFTKRLLSFGMVLGLGFLLIVSLLMSAALTALSGFISYMLPAGISMALLEGVTNLVSLTIFTALFAAMYKVLPDAEIEWRDVIAGGFATALLFTAGKHLIGLYLGQSDVTNVYGASGSLAVIFLWTYYASIVVLLGAELTRAWARTEKPAPPPEPGAIRVKRKELEVT
jgi:membrane protein